MLQGIVGGLTNRKIGDNMGLSESNVKNIVQRLFGRAGVKTAQPARARSPRRLARWCSRVRHPPNRIHLPIRRLTNGSRSLPISAASQSHQGTCEYRHKRFRYRSRATRTSWLRVRTAVFPETGGKYLYNALESWQVLRCRQALTRKRRDSQLPGVQRHWLQYYCRQRLRRNAGGCGRRLFRDVRDDGGQFWA